MSIGGVALLIDLGASRWKAALLNLERRDLSRIQDFVPPLPVAGLGPARFEIDPNALRLKFSELLNSYFGQKGDVSERTVPEAIFLCSEMHGFVAVNSSGEAVTPYISWQDERSRESGLFERIDADIGERFREITGMRLRSGFAFANLLHVVGQSQSLSAGPVRVVSLPEWLGEGLVGHQIATHKTMAVALGFYDLKRSAASTELLDYFESKCNVRPTFNELRSEDQPCAIFNFAGHKVELFVGVGDHQCALLGAGLSGMSGNDAFSVNIGTGSQVSLITQAKEQTREHNMAATAAAIAAAEFRPFFGHDLLATITHIPAGRVINAFLKFLGGESSYYWSLMSSIGVNEIISSKIEIDLALFEGSWGYRSGGGGVRGLTEYNLNSRDFLAGLLKSFGHQYQQVMDLLDPSREKIRVIPSGGIPRRLPELVKALEIMSGRKVVAPSSIDETLLGLKILAERAAGRGVIKGIRGV